MARLIGWTQLRCFLCMIGASLLVACSQSPEELLAHQWSEASWTFEKVDELPSNARRSDGLRVQAFEGRMFLRHEAEYWKFSSNHQFEIRLEDGQRHTGVWQLKGRGHILTLEYENGQSETFEVKELNNNELVLHVHLGVEVRGIARISFFRDDSRKPEKTGDQLAKASSHREVGS